MIIARTLTHEPGAPSWEAHTIERSPGAGPTRVDGERGVLWRCQEHGQKCGMLIEFWEQARDGRFDDRWHFTPEGAEATNTICTCYAGPWIVASPLPEAHPYQPPAPAPAGENRTQRRERLRQERQLAELAERDQAAEEQAEREREQEQERADAWAAEVRRIEERRVLLGAELSRDERVTLAVERAHQAEERRAELRRAARERREERRSIGQPEALLLSELTERRDRAVKVAAAKAAKAQEAQARLDAYENATPAEQRAMVREIEKRAQARGTKR